MSNRTFTRPRLRLLGTLCGLLLLPTLASNALVDDAPILLKMKFKMGDVTKYKMTMNQDLTANVNGQEVPQVMKTETTMEQKVTKTLPDGSAEVTATITDQKISVNDMDAPTQKTPPITMAYDAQGNVKSMKGLENSPGGGAVQGMMGGGVSNVLFSDKPVKVGDTWTLPLKMPSLTGTSKGTVKSTFVKTETVGGFQTARIRGEMTIPINMMTGEGGFVTEESKATMKMSGTVIGTNETNFAIAEGKLVRMTSKSDITMKMTPGPMAPANQPAIDMKGKQTMTMEIVP